MPAHITQCSRSEASDFFGSCEVATSRVRARCGVLGVQASRHFCRIRINLGEWVSVNKDGVRKWKRQKIWDAYLYSRCRRHAQTCGARRWMREQRTAARNSY